MLESGEEHTHEANRCEIGDASYPTLVFAQWDAELIPVDRLLLVVAQSACCGALVDDVVAAYLKVFGTYRHLILEVLLVLAQCVVLVDVLNVGRRLV